MLSPAAAHRERRTVRPCERSVPQWSGAAASHSAWILSKMARWSPGVLPLTIILSLCVSQGCDLRRPVVDSVADGTLAA